MPAGAPGAAVEQGATRVVSFLDPYEKNRRVSLLTIMRLAVWAVILGLGWLVWWWLGGSDGG